MKKKQATKTQAEYDTFFEDKKKLIQDFLDRIGLSNKPTVNDLTQTPKNKFVDHLKDSTK